MRRQPPVHSPMSARALVAGAAGAIYATPSTSTEPLLRTRWEAQDMLLTDSGTAALALAIRATTSRTSLVALPAFACYDLATAADGADASVVLYDVDPETLAPEPESLSRALSRGPGAVVLVHLYGVPVDVSAVRPAVDAVGAVIIEDAAQAFGTLLNGVPAGMMATFGVLSFGRGKGVSSGGGGALLATDARAAASLHSMREHVLRAHDGWSEWTRAAAQWLLARPAIYALPAGVPFLHLGETIYRDFSEARELSRAARRILEKNWERANAEVEQRRANAARLRAAVDASRNLRSIAMHPTAQCGYLRLPVLMDPAHREARLNARSTYLGVMSSYPRPLSQLSLFRRRCVNADERFPGAELLARSLITLPTHSLLTEADLEQLESWISSV